MICCRQCRFWARYAIRGSESPSVQIKVQYGNCHRLAPRPELNNSGVSTGLVLWPKTCEADWCGEGEVKDGLTI